MLEATVAFPDGGHEEHVAIHRRRCAEQAYVRLADALQIAAQAIHVGAVALYQWFLKLDIIRPMIFGTVRRPALIALAVVLLGVSSALVYALVVIYPKG